MKAPVYTLGDLAGSTQCSICGCLVADEARHTSFHEGLMRLLNIDAED